MAKNKISLVCGRREIPVCRMELTDATVFLTTCSNDNSDGSFALRDDFPSSMLCMSLEISDSGSMVVR